MSATNYLLPVSYGQKETSSLLLWVVGGGWLWQPAGCNFGREKGQGETSLAMREVVPGPRRGSAGTLWPAGGGSGPGRAARRGV